MRDNRVQHTTAVWYYHLLEGDQKWEKFPKESSSLIEGSYKSYGTQWAGPIRRYNRPFSPFVSGDEKQGSIAVDFKTLSLSVEFKKTSKNVNLKLKREEEFEVPPQRAQYDKECGVESVPKFANPFYESDYQHGGEQPFTLLEKKIMDLSAAIREKSDWESKYKNSEIANKWKSEYLERGGVEEVFNYVLSELSYLESLQHGAIKPSGVQGVWQADGLIPEELRQELLQEVAKLENVPAHEKDWHPGSNEQVLDLVHPSLFCLVAGTSRKSSPGHPPFKYIGGGKPVRDSLSLTEEQVKNKSEADAMFEQLKDATRGSPLYNELLQMAGLQPEDSGDNNEDAPAKISRLELKTKMDEIRQMRSSYLSTAVNNINLSKKFQWLPSDFQVDKSGKVSTLSYINNLEPRTNAKLYSILGKILETFIPMYDRVLTDLACPRERRYQPDPYGWYEEPEDMDDEDYDDYYENREPELPPLNDFSPPPPPSKTISLNGRRLQVIVKLANIILTPENPKYNGGVWHVEGMENEQIVSSGIYYYHSENITESRLHFRVGITEPDYEQNDNNGMRTVYGLENEAALNQTIGSVITQSGRSIAFPNLYQHWVAPFKLEDKSKVGIRKILVYFLVDPAVYITSTFSVPPQQPSWRKETLTKYRPFSALPDHVQTAIFDYAADTTLEQAKENRSELMKERKFFVKNNNEAVFEREFSLCEH